MNIPLIVGTLRVKIAGSTNVALNFNDETSGHEIEDKGEKVLYRGKNRV